MSWHRFVVRRRRTASPAPPEPNGEPLARSSLDLYEEDVTRAIAALPRLASIVCIWDHEEHEIYIYQDSEGRRYHLSRATAIRLDDAWAEELCLRQQAGLRPDQPREPTIKMIEG